MDFDLGELVSKLFQGLRGAASVFEHTDEEKSQDLPTMVRDGLRGAFSPTSPPPGVPGVDPTYRPNPNVTDEDRGFYKTMQNWRGGIRG